jgi:hypothetical protein
LHHSFKSKLIVLILLISTIIILSNLIILLFARLNEIPFSSPEDISKLLEGAENANLFKSIIALNHFFVFICAPLLFIFIFYRKEAFNYLSLKHFNPVLLLWFPIALFSLYPLMSFISFYVNQIEFPSFIDQLDKDSLAALSSLLRMDSWVDLVINLFIIGILPGLGEELLFRGIIQKELLGKINNPHVAILITSILFSAFHFQVTGFIPKLMIGMVLGYAYYLSGSLILSMILHVINNSFATIGLYLAGGQILPESIPNENVPIFSVLFSTILFIFIFNLIIQVSKSNPFKNGS